MNLTYTYDGSGSVLSINNGTYTETYTYDLIDGMNKTTGLWGTFIYSGLIHRG